MRHGLLFKRRRPVGHACAICISTDQQYVNHNARVADVSAGLSYIFNKQSSQSGYGTACSASGQEGRLRPVGRLPYLPLHFFEMIESYAHPVSYHVGSVLS